MTNNRDLTTGGLTIKLPETIKLVLDKLEKSGFSAYAVGGAVRDYILGNPVNDWDVTTSALPDETEKIGAVDGGLLTVSEKGVTLLSGSFQWK